MAETTTADTTPEPVAAAEPDVPHVVGVAVTIDTRVEHYRTIEHYNGRSWEICTDSLLIHDAKGRPVAEYQELSWIHVACMYEGDD